MNRTVDTAIHNENSNLVIVKSVFIDELGGGYASQSRWRCGV
jgi:hypothetical protein